MENEVKRYDAINILRIVCAYLVIVIHTMAFRSFGDGVLYITSQFICRISVPFFFIAAGYFFYQKINKKQYFKYYILRLIKIYIIANIIYSALYLSAFFPDMYQEFAEGGLEHILKTYLVNSISGGMWYFPALIMSIAVVYIFLKKNLIKSLIVTSVILLLIGLMGDSYYGLIINTPFIHIIDAYDSIFDNTRNGFTFGIPFLTIGVIINKYKLNERIKRPAMFLGLSGIIFGAEAYFLMHSGGIPKDYNIYFSAALFVSMMFIMALNSKIKISEKASSYIREMSLWIYVYHLLIPTILYLININIENSIINYLIVCIIATLIAFIITKTKYKNRNFNKIKDLNAISQ